MKIQLIWQKESERILLDSRKDVATKRAVLMLGPKVFSSFCNSSFGIQIRFNRGEILAIFLKFFKALVKEKDCSHIFLSAHSKPIKAWSSFFSQTIAFFRLNFFRCSFDYIGIFAVHWWFDDREYLKRIVTGFYCVRPCFKTLAVIVYIYSVFLFLRFCSSIKPMWVSVLN